MVHKEGRALTTGNGLRLTALMFVPVIGWVYKDLRGSFGLKKQAIRYEFYQCT